MVTGLSGAGRSTALQALSDLGYYCIDNLPPLAFGKALEACARDDLARVAVGIDVRVESFLAEVVASLEDVKRKYDFTLLFLDASDAVLSSRFSSTRRPHPLDTLATAASERSMAVARGIQLERERLAPLRANASLTIDTSELTVHVLRRRIVELFRPRVGEARRMMTRLVSFGFKYGPPGDCDMVFDVRFLKNPYFVPELKPLSGLDAPIAEFVCEIPAARRFVEQAFGMLGWLIPAFEEEGKSYLTVGIGCTGGRHRSVAMVEWIAAKLRESDAAALQVAHRDVGRVDREKRLREMEMGQG